MDNYGKKKVEIPIKKIVASVSKTTQIDIPTTNQKREPITKKKTYRSALLNLIKIQTSLNIENELENLKIPIPLRELMKKTCKYPN